MPKRSRDMHGMPGKIGRVIASSGPLTSTSIDLPNSPLLDSPPSGLTLRRNLPRMQSTTESYTSTRRLRSKLAKLMASAAPTNPRIISCRGRTGCLFALQISLQGISRASGVRGTAVARSCHVLVGSGMSNLRGPNGGPPLLLMTGMNQAEMPSHETFKMRNTHARGLSSFEGHLPLGQRMWNEPSSSYR